MSIVIIIISINEQ